jgi:hypothetical protein
MRIDFKSNTEGEVMNVLAIGLLILLVVFCCRALAVEEPSYKVLNQYEEFEIRQYPAYIVAETLVGGSAEDASYNAFSRLAGYIFGGNQGSNSIAMTAPVAQMPVRLNAKEPVNQQKTLTGTGETGYLVQFSMPSAMTLQTLPKPNDSRVTLRELPERKVAVIRYSGRWTDSAYQQQLEKLTKAMREQGLAWQGEPVWARYNSPWMPSFLRRNEIFLQIK